MSKEKTAEGAMFKKGDLAKVISPQYKAMAFIGCIARHWSGGSVLLVDSCKVLISTNKKTNVFDFQFVKNSGKFAITGKDLLIEEMTEEDDLYAEYKRVVTGIAVVSEKAMRGLNRIKTN